MSSRVLSAYFDDFRKGKRQREELRQFMEDAIRKDPIRRGHFMGWLDQAQYEHPIPVTEFLLLEALAAHPGVIKSRNQLMDAAYPDDVFVDDRTVDSHIKRMRRKFRSVDDEFSAIETLYGAGYSFSDG